MTEPTIVELPARPYVGLTETVTMQTVGKVADRIPELFGWLATRGIAPTGPPFFRYHVIDMDRELRVEAGVPVASPVDGDGGIAAGTLPAGRYVTATHVGHPDGLIEATGRVLAWAAERDLRWDMTEADGRQAWGCRLEVFLTDPATQPDMASWETALQLRLAES